jgi:hypothetical protein
VVAPLLAADELGSPAPTAPMYLDHSAFDELIRALRRRRCGRSGVAGERGSSS